MAAEPDVVEGQGAEGELGDEDGTGGVEAFGDSGVGGGDAVLEGFGPPGGGDVGSVKEIFCTPRYAVKGAAIVAGGDLGIGGFGLREGVVAGAG